MIGTITLLNGNRISRPEYIAYRASLHNTTEEVIRGMMHRCEKGDSDFPEDFPESLFVAAESVCADIARSGGEVDPIIEEQVHQHTRTETPPEAPQEDHGQIALQNHETRILEAARNTNLANGWERLSPLFSFGENFDELRSTGPVSPEDVAAVMGYGVSMSKAGVFVAAKAMLRLQALGHDAIVEQYAAEKGLGYSTVSGWLRMEQRIPEDSPARRLLDPTAIAEIVNARYSKDEEENERIRNETLSEACEKKVDTNEARSLVLRVKGESSASKDKPSLREQLSEADREISKLKGALHEIAIIQNSDSGGDWDEIEKARFVARKALGIPEPCIVEQVEQDAA